MRHDGPLQPQPLRARRRLQTEPQGLFLRVRGHRVHRGRVPHFPQLVLMCPVPEQTSREQVQIQLA